MELDSQPEAEPEEPDEAQFLAASAALDPATSQNAVVVVPTDHEASAAQEVETPLRPDDITEEALMATSNIRQEDAVHDTLQLPATSVKNTQRMLESSMRLGCAITDVLLRKEQQDHAGDETYSLHQAWQELEAAEDGPVCETEVLGLVSTGPCDHAGFHIEGLDNDGEENAATTPGARGSKVVSQQTTTPKTKGRASPGGAAGGKKTKKEKRKMKKESLLQAGAAADD
ncbi:unnamed protein product, partial [Amoebophrya sp. A120]|eukprot:GSA120T00009452001.1